MYIYTKYQNIYIYIVLYHIMYVYIYSIIIYIYSKKHICYYYHYCSYYILHIYIYYYILYYILYYIYILGLVMSGEPVPVKHLEGFSRWKALNVTKSVRAHQLDSYPKTRLTKHVQKKYLSLQCVFPHLWAVTILIMPGLLRQIFDPISQRAWCSTHLAVGYAEHSL